MKLPIEVTAKFIEKFNAIGFSFAIWIFIHPKLKGSKRMRVVLHEKIHYKQQLELLFIFHWILYGWWHIFRGYDKNPFELEADENEHNELYLNQRKPYSWRKYI